MDVFFTIFSDHSYIIEPRICAIDMILLVAPDLESFIAQRSEALSTFRGAGVLRHSSKGMKEGRRLVDFSLR